MMVNKCTFLIDFFLLKMMCTLQCYNCHFSSPVFWKLEWFSFSALINTQCGSMYFARFEKIWSTVCNSFYSLTQEITHNQTLSYLISCACIANIFFSYLFLLKYIQYTIGHADSPLVTLIYFGKFNVEKYVHLNQNDMCFCQ